MIRLRYGRRPERLGVPFTWFGRCHQIPLLEPMLQRFPEVNVIVDHLGEPVLAEGLDGSFQHPPARRETSESLREGHKD